MLNDLAERPVASRAVSCSLFLLVLAAFSLPFAEVTADARSARGSGVEFALDRVHATGRYVHAAYEGEVERLVDLAVPVGMATLVTLLLAVLLVWLPWKWGPAAGFTLGGVVVVELVWLHQTVNSVGTFAGTTYGAGYWLSLGLAIVAIAWCVFHFVRTPFWWKADTGPRRDYFAEL